jgi:hypothetical protein
MGAGGALVACAPRVGSSRFESDNVPESRAQKHDKRLGVYERASLRNMDSDRPNAPPQPFHTLILTRSMMESGGLHSPSRDRNGATMKSLVSCTPHASVRVER